AAPVTEAAGLTAGAANDPAPTAAVAGKASAVPFVFEAKVLVGDGGRQRERDCQVVLADGKIHVQANDDQNLVRVVPYDWVQSISYRSEERRVGKECGCRGSAHDWRQGSVSVRHGHRPVRRRRTGARA